MLPAAPAGPGTASASAATGSTDHPAGSRRTTAARWRARRRQPRSFRSSSATGPAAAAADRVRATRPAGAACGYGGTAAARAIVRPGAGYRDGTGSCGGLGVAQGHTFAALAGQRHDQLAEGVTTRFVIAELVEAGAGGGQQHHIAGSGGGNR